MSRHEKLLQQYADELRTAKHFAEQWWAYLQAVERQKMGSQEIADRVLRRRWPDGPASHPRVLAVVRKYWLLCEDLNQAIEAQTQHREAAEPRFRLAPDEDPYGEGGDSDDAEEEHVDPHVFVLEWLMDDDLEVLASFVGTLSYWPVGLDADDAYT